MAWDTLRGLLADRRCGQVEKCFPHSRTAFWFSFFRGAAGGNYSRAVSRREVRVGPSLGAHQELSQKF